MDYTVDEFYHDLRQEALAGSEARLDYLESEFLLVLCKELEDSGIIEGFEPCHYRAPRGVRVDGYWFDEDDEALNLFIVDFANRESLESLTATDVTTIFRRLENFFINSVDKKLYADLEESSLGYGLARDVFDRQKSFSKVNLYLVSDRNLSERVQAIEDSKHKLWLLSYNVWDISRFFRLQTARGAKEDLLVDFRQLYGHGLQCLPAHLVDANYESYLLVMPGQILADLFGRYGARLLEQNVRCFLQARGKVNKGIRATIMNDPGMFFAYNNGITATAKEVLTDTKDGCIFINAINDLQIVNGGQTTASLFHTNRKDKASLDQVFIQVKLSVVNVEKSEEVVPKISEYANTQNPVKAADFFSNHPFHIRFEEFSRRLWAPPLQGALRESKWFYERARGQYADAQAKLSGAGMKKFLVEFPKSQMFTKTDLAKYENVWDEKPTYVNLGAQKNFSKYAERIGKEWEKNSDSFNEFYYKCAIARGILFKRTEKIVSAQPWYQGGYRANIVAYTLAMLSEYAKASHKSLNLIQIWNKQDISAATAKAITTVGKAVAADISDPQEGISNISEWCKKDDCWSRLKRQILEITKELSSEFISELVPLEKMNDEAKDASKTQKIDNGILAQAQVIKYSGQQWKVILESGSSKGIFTEKEIGILEVATKIPYKLPSEKQSTILLDVIEKAAQEGILIHE